MIAFDRVEIFDIYVYTKSDKSHFTPRFAFIKSYRYKIM